MKKIVAVLQPSKFEAVKQALMDIGVDGMTASETRGYGRQKGHKEVFRGREYTVDLLPKIKLEIVTPRGAPRGSRRSAGQGCAYRTYRRRQDLRL